jgi:hypothetical protein
MLGWDLVDLLFGYGFEFAAPVRQLLTRKHCLRLTVPH